MKNIIAFAILVAATFVYCGLTDPKTLDNNNVVQCFSYNNGSYRQCYKHRDGVYNNHYNCVEAALNFCARYNKVTSSVSCVSSDELVTFISCQEQSARVDWFSGKNENIKY